MGRPAPQRTLGTAGMGTWAQGGHSGRIHQEVGLGSTPAAGSTMDQATVCLKAVIDLYNF